MPQHTEEFLLQWNANSVVSHWAEFREYIVNKKPLVAAIQETHFLDTDSTKYNFNLFGYSLYCNNVNDSPRRGGSALYVSNNLLHHQVNFDSNLNYVATTIKIAQRDVNVISLYLSPSINVTYQQLDRLFGQIPSPKLIIGDFNAHHTAWGCNNITQRGTTLYNIINKHNLICLNDKSPTFHRIMNGTNQYSIIDLVLTSPEISLLFTPKVQIDQYFSDHYPMHITVESSSRSTINTYLPKWNFNKADWTTFQDDIDEQLDILSFNDNTNNNVNDNDTVNIESFLQIIGEAAERSVPLTKQRQGYKHAPWWTENCQKAVARRRRALRKCRACPCVAHEIQLRNEIRNAKEVINAAKKESWESFSNKFNRFTPITKVWEHLRCFRINKPKIYKIPSLIIQNTLTADPQAVATQFAAHYANISSNNNYSGTLHNNLSTTLSTLTFQSDNTEHYNHLFTLYELQHAIVKCGNTSVGPDKLPYMFFRKLTPFGLEHFLKVINQLWVEGHFPDSWRESIIIPILKKDKHSTDPASYRPISLSSCASKIVERMVNNRIRVYLESQHKLSQHQNGFRPARSTADNLIHIIDTIQQGFFHNKVTAALFLDLKAAFDKVHHKAILIKTHNMGIRGRMANFISNFLNNRTFKVRVGNTYSTLHNLDHGVPQGSPLSPTLFLIYINDIFDNIHNVTHNVHYSMYADDLAVWTSHHNVNAAYQKLQTVLNHVNKWCDKWGMQIAPHKSASLTFSKQRRHPTPPRPLRLGRVEIPQTNTFKYLGITLDRGLTFTQHIADITGRCTRRLNIMKCISGTHWGADRKTLTLLYTSLIRSILDYNAFLLTNISTTLSNKVESIQNSALRIISGALRTSPSSNLRVDSNIPPLERRREYQLIRYYTKVMARKDTIPYAILSNLPENNIITHREYKYQTIRRHLKNILRDYKIETPKVLDNPPLSPYWTRHPIQTLILFDDNKKDMNTDEMKQLFLEFQNDHKDHTFIYTDGSRADNKTGAAFYIKGFAQSTRLSDNHSIFSAELYAISAALRHVINKPDRQLMICTDSKAAVQSIAAAHNDSHPITRDIKRQINQITDQNREVKIIWIPGHANIVGNERADKAAKASLRDPPNNSLPCPVSDYLNVIYASYKKYVQFEWDVNPHYYFHPIKPIIGHWPTAYQNTRLKEVIIARLRIGHTKLTHEYIFDQGPPPICQRCNIRYTIEHFLIHCPQYQAERQPIIQYITHNQLALSIPTLLGDSHPDLLDLLFTFLKNSRLDRSI